MEDSVRSSAVPSVFAQPAPGSVADRIRPFVRKYVLGIRPYVPGRPEEDVRREFGVRDVVKLASNENPLGPSPLAVEAMGRALSGLNRYPDGAAQSARGSIADRYRLTPEHVLLGNGSDEIIKMIAEAFLEAGDQVVTAFPSFSQYSFGPRIMGAEVVEVPLKGGFSFDLDGVLDRITPRTKIVYLCSPNNPTGTVFSHSEAASFIERVPEGVVTVFDEAYLEYVDAPDPLDSLAFVRAGKAVLSLRTFSKMYGLAGLRLGYALGDPGLIRYLHLVREPFNVNATAQAAVSAALSDRGHVARSREANRLGREQYYSGLARLGVEFVRTQGNFLLARVGNGRETADALERRGVIVRAGFPGLDEYVRISVGSEEENEVCLASLAEVLRR